MKVFDLHCDTLSELRRAEMRGDGQTFARNNGHIDLEKLEKGDYMLQCFAAFVNLADPTPGADPLVTALEEIDVFRARWGRCQAPRWGWPARFRGSRSGSSSARPARTSGAARPDCPCSSRPPQWSEMERLHIIADVSHLSDKGFWDIAEHSTRPFAASHSNCRALAPHCRNLTDEMIRVMAEKGGLVGLNYCAGFLDDQPSPDLCRSTTALMAKHAAHFKQVGGIEIIGLGSDFDGIGGKLELSDCSKMPLLADALRKEGFTEDEVEAIFFRNAQRFFENNL